MAIQRVRPAFVATSLIVGENRTPRVVLEANRDHNSPRTARLERVVFVNDLTPEQALDAVCDREGELDIVTEVSPADAARVEALRARAARELRRQPPLAGIFNTWPEHDAPLGDQRVREALNLAVDRARLVAEGLGGHGTPHGRADARRGATGSSRTRRRARATPTAPRRSWPTPAAGRPAGALRLATPASLAGLAALIAGDVRTALGIAVDVIEVPDEGLVAGARQLVEKKLTPEWDVLLHAWFDLSSDLPPAVVHREFFGTDGAFRAGPEDPEFDRRFAELVRQTDPAAATAGAEDLDRYCFDACKALFLCAPQGAVRGQPPRPLGALPGHLRTRRRRGVRAALVTRLSRHGRPRAARSMPLTMLGMPARGLAAVSTVGRCIERTTSSFAAAGLLQTSPSGSGQTRAGSRHLEHLTHAKAPLCGAVCDAPDRIRTCDLRFRRPTLYPAELRALAAPG